MFDKILIANRGEIACRVIETAKKLGIITVAVYSEADAEARHVRLADEAYPIGGAEARDSYLRPEKILQVAKDCGAGAIHPGYGFLSENADFSESCKKAGIAFIGPSGDSIRSMGLKDKAKDIMSKAAVPVVPGYQGAEQNEDFLEQQAGKIGYPLLIKAVAGGGGKGMRMVEKAEDFRASLASCQREAEASFGNSHVLLEKYLTRPRHIEVQVFGDNFGDVVYLFERDCSLQRRHQKVVEEAPAPGMSEDMRSEMGMAAVKAAKAIAYQGAGTIEFIVDVEQGLDNAPFYFMEMNTRLQVEHPVTEAITGQDLVEWQIRVAAGERLPLKQEDLSIYGHSFEVRLYAEDPENNFMPQTGLLNHFSTPDSSAAFRLDTGVEEGDPVSIYYDPMIAKLITWGRDRATALRHMQRALEQTAVAGLRCNLEFLGNIFSHASFIEADLDTGFIEKYSGSLMPGGLVDPVMIITASLVELEVQKQGQDLWGWSDGFRANMTLETELTFVDHDEKRPVKVRYLSNGFQCQMDEQTYDVHLLSHVGNDISLMIDGQKITARVIVDGQDFTIFHGAKIAHLHLYKAGTSGEEDGGSDGVIVTPMPGKVTRVMIAEGDHVQEGDSLMILEAMKMEHTIKAPVGGMVEKLGFQENDQVGDGAVLIRIEGEEA